MKKIVASVFAVALVSIQSLAGPLENKFIHNITQLITEGERSGEGYFSADGSKLIFQSEHKGDNPFYQIYLYDFKTNQAKQVSNGIGKTTCSWIHPDGKRALFASTHEDPDAKKEQKAEIDRRASGKPAGYAWDFDEFYDIYEADLATGNLKPLTRSRGYDAEGAYSPDGNWIVFASNRGAYFKKDPSYFMDLYIMKSDGSDVRRLTTTPGYDGGPFFSPDGKRIIWRHFNAEGSVAEVFTMSVDGSDVKQITRLGAMSWAPYYHPSGDYIIFVTNLQGHRNFELYAVDSEARHAPVRVTDTEGFDGLPVFSPDGKRLSWASSRTANHSAQIFIADWDDAEIRSALGLPARTRKPSGFDADITVSDVKKHVETLASEQFEGRLTGSAGQREASQYVADFFQSIGLAPQGDESESFFQYFTFTSGVSLGPANQLRATQGLDKKVFVLDQQWRPLSFSKSGIIPETPVVFAGYGIDAPAGGGSGEGDAAYDSYAGIDPSELRGRWVMVFRYLPEEISPARKNRLALFSDLRQKAMIAREKGAVGIIVVSGPNSNVKKQLVDLSVDANLASSSLYGISVSDEVAQDMVATGERKLKDLQDELDRGNAVQGFVLPKVALAGEMQITQVQNNDRNVIGRLQVTRGKDSKEAVWIGAHLDHLGRGEPSTSRARDDEKGMIHYGADDNASGVAALLEIAQFLSAKKALLASSRRDIVFAAWSGEELGTLGSSHTLKALTEKFARKPNESLQPDVSAYLNMDMIGRLKDAVYFQGTDSSSVWTQLLVTANTGVGLAISSQGDPYLPTDSMPFYLRMVPTLNAFTGSHDEYHTPRDKPETLNYGGATAIARLMTNIVSRVAVLDQVPDYKLVPRKPGQGVRPRRIYLGTIPDYTADAIVIKGLKISGVQQGSPAQKAGLQGGDVVVSLAGHAVENIYDYMYVLNILRSGESVVIEIQRGDTRLKLDIVPESKD